MSFTCYESDWGVRTVIHLDGRALTVREITDLLNLCVSLTADCVPLTTHHGPLYCPKCGGEVDQRDSFNTYCPVCGNPDSFGEPPLPLFYDQCFADPEKRKVTAYAPKP